MIKNFYTFINESKVEKLMNDYYDDIMDYDEAGENEGGLPKDYETAAKKLSKNFHKDVGVLFGVAQEDWHKTLADFKKSGIKMIEIKDAETGDGAIIVKYPKWFERNLPR